MKFGNGKTLFLVALYSLTAMTTVLGIIGPIYFSEPDSAQIISLPGEHSTWKIIAIRSNVAIDDDVRLISDKTRRQRLIRSFEPPFSIARKLQISASVEIIDRKAIYASDVLLYVRAKNSENRVLRSKVVFRLPDLHSNNVASMVTLATLTRFSEVFHIPDGTTALEIVVASREGAPSVLISDLSMVSVDINLWYELALISLVLAWLAAMMIALIYVTYNIGIVECLSVLLFLALSLLGLSVSSVSLYSLFHPVLQMLNDYLSFEKKDMLRVFLTSLHFLSFTLITVALLINKQRMQLTDYFLLQLLVIIACASEAFQLHISGRGGELFDLFLDLIGIFVGIILIALSSRIKYRRFIRQ